MVGSGGVGVGLGGVVFLFTCEIFSRPTRVPKSREQSSSHAPNTVILSSTLGVQRKVTKLPCFWYLLFRTQFQHFLDESFLAIVFFFFAVQLALVSMIKITLFSSQRVFSLRRTRLFRTCEDQGRTRGEHGLYFAMLRRLDLWLFSWLSVAPKQRSPKLSVSWLTLYGLVDRFPVSAGNIGRALQRPFSVDFQIQNITGKIFSCSKRACFCFCE